MKLLESFFKLSERKFKINSKMAQKTFPGKDYWDWLSHTIYLPWIKNEVDEVVPEIKKNNSVYLEDELWDIFWAYINLLHCLEMEWYISKEKVFKRAYKKYDERITGLEDWVLWDDIKVTQKTKLKKEHNLKYNS